MLQQSCRLLQGYCSTHLFYFIAHEPSPATKYTHYLVKINKQLGYRRETAQCILQFNSQNDKHCICELPLEDFMDKVSALLLGRWKCLLLIIELYRLRCACENTTLITSKSTLFEVGELIFGEMFGWKLRFSPTLLHH